jgi:hypothetical protein
MSNSLQNPLFCSLSILFMETAKASLLAVPRTLLNSF